MKAVNLSRRPFVNARPVFRVSLILWILGVLFLGTNLWLYSSYWIESADIRNRLAGVESTIREEEAGLRELDQRFDALDLEDLNEQAVFLNRLIASRTFPWSALFDHLEEVLPRGVRLESVQPSLADDEPTSRLRRVSRRGARDGGSRRIYDESGPAEVLLSLNGIARSGEELLAFVDALYAHPSFREPVLRNERLENPGNTLRFDLAALYLVSSPSPAGAIASAGFEETAEVGSEVITAAGEPAAGEPAAGSGPAAVEGGGIAAAERDLGAAGGTAVSASGPATGRVDGGRAAPASGAVESGGGSRAAAGARSNAERRRLAAAAERPSESEREPVAESEPYEHVSAGDGMMLGDRLPPSVVPRPEAAPGRTAPAARPGGGRDPRFVTPGASGTPRLGGGGQPQ